jgi:hypothetical protein
MKQACVQQKLSGSSFEGGYISGITAGLHYARTTEIIHKSCVGKVLMHTGLLYPNQTDFSA